MECTLCRRRAPRSAKGESKTYRLLCGDVMCPVCLVERARMSLHVPKAIPATCCHRNIRTEWIAEVLEPPEMVYYNFLLSKRLQEDPPPSGSTALKPGKTTTVVIDEGDESDEVVMIEVVPASGALGAMTRSKAAKARAKHELVVDLEDETSKEDASNGPGTAPPICFSCQDAVPQEKYRIQAPCSHYLCVKCVKNRCIRALDNEKQGGIGMPVLCCKQIVPLEVVSPALTRRQNDSYKALFAKRKDMVKHIGRGRATGKRKAASPAVVVAPVRQSSVKKRAKTQALDEDDAAEDERSRQQQSQDENDEDNTAGECVACLSDLTNPKDRFRGPCGHLYCTQCLAIMARQSLEDRSLVPIRCCATEFPLEYVARVLPARSMATYKRFLSEKDWRSSNLKSDQEYAKMVKKLRGKQCPTCGIGVQKISGCNAMTCVRGHRFCWACGLANCNCIGAAVARAYGNHF